MQSTRSQRLTRQVGPVQVEGDRWWRSSGLCPSRLLEQVLGASQVGSSVGCSGCASTVMEGSG